METRKNNIKLLLFLIGGFLLSSPSLQAQSKTEFYRVLASKEVASFKDAVNAIAALHRGEYKQRPYKIKLKRLRKLEIIPEDWEFDPNKTLERGELAYMVCKVLKIKGGLITRIFGMSQRYAYKELTFRKIMAPGTASDRVKGEELLSVIRSAGRYRKKHIHDE